MGILFIFVFAALIIAFIFAPGGQQQQNLSKATLDDFSFPDNSSSRTVPRVYGTAYLKGNLIYYGNLNSTEIIVSY